MDRAGLIVRLVVTLGIAATAMGAQDPDAILGRSADAHRKLHSLEVTGLLAAPMTRDGVAYEVRWPVSMAQGDSTMLPADSPVPVLSPLLRFGQAEFGDGSGSAAPLDPPELSSPKGWSLFDQIDQNVRQVRLLPNETVELDSHSVSCWVLEVDYTPGFPSRALSGSAIRYRIDPSSLLVLGVSFSSRDAGGREMIPWTFTARSVETNQRPPEWALRMLPQLAGEERDEWRTRRAPEFTLSDLDGREVSLASLRGKAVLLSFWASWCAPCKEELPLLEKLKAEWEPEGLEVWAITNESAAKARAWLNLHGIGLRTLVDEDRNAFRAYDAEQIPVSVVLDRDGAVVSYIVGLGGETYFRTAIEKALAGGVAAIQ
jgi:peroxiredoxin